MQLLPEEIRRTRQDLPLHSTAIMAARTPAYSVSQDVLEPTISTGENYEHLQDSVLC